MDFLDPCPLFTIQRNIWGLSLNNRTINQAIMIQSKRSNSYEPTYDRQIFLFKIMIAERSLRKDHWLHQILSHDRVLTAKIVQHQHYLCYDLVFKVRFRHTLVDFDHMRFLSRSNMNSKTGIYRQNTVFEFSRLN